MYLTDFLFDVGKPQTYYPSLSGIVGGTNPNIFLTYILAWQGNNAQGEVFRTQAQIQEDTGLTRREQDTCRQALKSLGLLNDERRGTPAKVFYRANIARLNQLWATRTNKTGASVPYSLYGVEEPMHRSAKQDAPMRQTRCTDAPNFTIKGQKEGEEEKSFAGVRTRGREVAALWSTHTGKRANPGQVAALEQLADQLTERGHFDWLEKAIKVAAENGTCTIPYVRGTVIRSIDNNQAPGTPRTGSPASITRKAGDKPTSPRGPNSGTRYEPTAEDVLAVEVDRWERNKHQYEVCGKPYPVPKPTLADAEVLRLKPGYHYSPPTRRTG